MRKEKPLGKASGKVERKEISKGGIQTHGGKAEEKSSRKEEKKDF